MFLSRASSSCSSISSSFSLASSRSEICLSSSALSRASCASRMADSSVRQTKPSPSMYTRSVFWSFNRSSSALAFSTAISRSLASLKLLSASISIWMRLIRLPYEPSISGSDKASFCFSRASISLSSAFWTARITES